MFGGWTGNPIAHAMYYEIIPIAEDKANVRIYNLGGGTEQHPSEIVETEETKPPKEKRQPFLELKQISSDKLLDERFLTVIGEMKKELIDPITKLPTSYNARELYGIFKDHLKPGAVSDQLPDQDPILMNPQKAGTCTWRSLMAYMRTHMDKEDYNQMKCDIMLQSLVDYVEKLNTVSAPPLDVTTWNLVHKSFHKLSRKLERLHAEGVLSQNYLSSAISALEPIKGWIKAHETVKLMAEPAYKDYDPIKEINTSFVSPLTTPLEQLAQGTAIDTSLQPCTYVYDQVAPYLSLGPEDLVVQIPNIINIFKEAWEKGEDLAINTAFLDFVDKLPLDPAFWERTSGKDPEKAKTFMVQLSQLSKLFFKSCFTIPNAHLLHSEKLQSLYKIIDIQTKLAPIVAPNELKNLVLHLPNEFSNANKFYTLFTPQLQKDLETYKMQNGMSQIFTRMEADKTKPVGARHKTSERALTKVIESFEKIEPMLRTACEMSHPDFINLSPHEQNAILLTTPYLRQWMQSFRDPYIYFSYLLKRLCQHSS